MHVVLFTTRYENPFFKLCVPIVPLRCASLFGFVLTSVSSCAEYELLQEFLLFLALYPLAHHAEGCGLFPGLRTDSHVSGCARCPWVYFTAWAVRKNQPRGQRREPNPARGIHNPTPESPCSKTVSTITRDLGTTPKAVLHTEPGTLQCIPLGGSRRSGNHIQRTRARRMPACVLMASLTHTEWYPVAKECETLEKGQYGIAH